MPVPDFQSNRITHQVQSIMYHVSFSMSQQILSELFLMIPLKCCLFQWLNNSQQLVSGLPTLWLYSPQNLIWCLNLFTMELFSSFNSSWKNLPKLKNHQSSIDNSGNLCCVSTLQVITLNWENNTWCLESLGYFIWLCNGDADVILSIDIRRALNSFAPIMTQQTESFHHFSAENWLLLI